VPPKAVIKGPDTMLIAPRGAALNLQNREIYVIDKIQNGFFAYSWDRLLEAFR
jgi:hypothetical protein